jgi:hypothetical protein
MDSQISVRVEGWPGTIGYYVHCSYCGARGSVHTTQEEAIKAWNSVFGIAMEKFKERLVREGEWIEGGNDPEPMI